MARAGKYTAAIMIKALKQTGGMVCLAADLIGCDPKTVKSYIAQYPTVAQAQEDEAERFLDYGEVKLKERVFAGDAWAIQFFLRTKGRDRGYNERTEVTGKDGKDFTFVVKYADN